MNVHNVQKMKTDVQCHCGKLCKVRGLRTHQRFCTISDVPESRKLFHEEIITNDEYFDDKNFEEVTFTPQTKLPTPGVKLPKTTESWNRENEFFKSTLDVNKEIRNVDENVCYLQDTIYKYLKNECGTVAENEISAEFRSKYDHLPKREIKRALRELKRHSLCFKVHSRKIS